jgi:hypothetical protein
MTISRSAIAVLAIFFFCVTAAIAAAISLFGQMPEVCDGAPRELGGCTQDQPVFSGGSCAGVGREFGVQLDERAIAIINGPQNVNGESRSVRLDQQVLLVMTRANKHIRNQGMARECDADEFVTAAEHEFSVELRKQAGNYLYDTVERPYEEWRHYLYDIVALMIDTEEDAPFNPPTSG